MRSAPQSIAMCGHAFEVCGPALALISLNVQNARGELQPGSSFCLPGFSPSSLQVEACLSRGPAEAGSPNHLASMRACCRAWRAALAVATSVLQPLVRRR